MTPSQSTPLTEEQIDALYLSKLAGRGPFDGVRSAFIAMVRTVEAAHGIGSDSAAATLRGMEKEGPSPLTDSEADRIHSMPWVRDCLLRYVDRPCDKEARDVVHAIVNAVNGLPVSMQPPVQATPHTDHPARSDNIRQFLHALQARNEKDNGLFPQAASEVEADAKALRRVLAVLDFYHPPGAASVQGMEAQSNAALADGFDGSAMQPGLNHSTVLLWYDTEAQASSALRVIRGLIEAAQVAAAAPAPQGMEAQSDTNARTEQEKPE